MPQRSSISTMARSPPLNSFQIQLLQSLETDYYNGKSSATSFEDFDNTLNDTTTNKVRPPVDCPKWVCCLLPCIKFIPSMKRFQSILPEDAEVLRQGGEWVIYEASSVTLGDILRVRDGDRVPADCVVLSLGNDHVNEELDNPQSNDDELVVDESDITGRSKPVTIRANAFKDSKKLHTLHYGSQILHGVAIVVVTAIGSKMKLATLIKQGNWPPSSTNAGSDSGNDSEDGDEEAGLSLLPRTT